MRAAAIGPPNAGKLPHLRAYSYSIRGATQHELMAHAPDVVIPDVCLQPLDGQGVQRGAHPPQHRQHHLQRGLKHCIAGRQAWGGGLAVQCKEDPWGGPCWP